MSRSVVSGEIAPAILDEAAAWLVQLYAADVSMSDRQAWQQWHGRSPAHALAWARAERLLTRLGGLPNELARPLLNRNHDAMRRQMLGKLVLLMAAGPTAWTVCQHGPEWTADYRTAIGEQLSFTLADGSSVMLNTDSALDVQFDLKQRSLHLIRGEVLINTAKDAQTPPRPFLVESAQGVMSALGTHFSVQQLDGLTRLTVLEGAVEIQPRAASSQRLIVQAEEVAHFSRGHIEAPRPASENNIAWRHGMLIADAMTLSGLLAELSRYRRGVLRCEPAVAELKVSGAFPIKNTDRSLSMLQTTYPVQIRYVSRYWVTVAAL